MRACTRARVRVRVRVRECVCVCVCVWTQTHVSMCERERDVKHGQTISDEATSESSNTNTMHNAHKQ
jgi:hypothetical protein